MRFLGGGRRLIEHRAKLVDLLKARAASLEWDIELKFPVELKIEATPLSLQASPESKRKWQQQVKDTARAAAGPSTWATESPVFVTIFYFPDGRMQGDVDNIVKPILDGMNGCIYLDDKQVQRVLVQKFESDRIFSIDNPTSRLADALEAEPPVVYIRVDSDSSVE